MRKRNPHVFCRGTVDPISLGVLALIVTSIVIGTVAVIRTASFDIRQRAQTYPTRYSCQSGSCVSDPNGEFLSIGECDPLCNAPVASPRLPNGSNCSSNSQCSSNFCNNGICQNPATCSVSCQNGCYSSTNTCIPYCDQTKCSQGCIYDTSAGGECRTGISQCVHQSESCDPSTNIAELECCYGLYCQVSSGGAKCISDIATTQCDTSKCPLGCITGTTTCKVFCDENKCPYGCSSQTSSGGSCNPAPPPPPVTSNGSCYYGTISCTSLNRYSASGCLSSCPTSMIAACCGDVIPEAAKICTPNVTRCANSTALEMCTNNGTGWITQTCASGLKCENNKCVTPTQVGDSCSQPHGKSVSGNIYCCNGTAQSSECSGSVAHYPGQVGELPEHTWCEWGVFASCARCKDGKTYSQNNKDYCGTTPAQTAPIPVTQPAVTYANPLESVIASIILSDPDYFASALQTADCGNASNTDIGKLFACNFMVTQARANVENNLQGELNRFGTWAPLLGIPAVILAAAEVGPAAIAVAGGAAAGGQQAGNVVYQHLLQFGQTSFGQSLTNFGNQLFNSTEGVIVQLGLERAFGIDLSIADFSYSGLQTTGAFQTNNPIFHNQLGESLIISTKYEGLLSRIAQAQNQSAPSNQIFSTTNLQFEIPTVSNSQFAKNFVQNIPAHILNDPELFEQYLGQQIKAAFPYYRSDTRQISILADKAGNLDTLVNMLDTGICTGVLCRQVAPIVY